MFDYIKLPMLDAEGTGGSAEGAAAGAEAATTTTTEQTGVTTGEADPVPDGTKPNAAWMEMRRKAKEADELRKKLDEYEKNSKSVQDYEAKLKKLEKVLPDGYSSLDELLETLESDETIVKQPSAKPTFDEKSIESIVKKAIESMPEIQMTKKEREDRYLVESFMEVQKKFPDIKKAQDIPNEVWDAWDEGKKGRTLLSFLKEYRYDSDVEKAKKQAADQTKAQAMGTAHTNQVQGTKEDAEYDNVQVPDEVKAMMMRNPILRKKIESDPTYLKRMYATKHRQ